MAKEGNPKYLSKPNAAQVAARRDGWMAAKAQEALRAISNHLSALEALGHDRRLSASVLALKTAARHLSDSIPKEAS